MTHDNKPWDKNLQLLLAMIVGMNVVPHASDVPVWITGVAGACIAWKVAYLTRGLALPRKWFLWIATGGATIGVFVSYGTIFGQEAAGALLVMMASLKLLETNRYRDAMLVIFTSYFLLMAHLLASQSLGSTIFMICDVLVITALMLQVHRRDRRSSPRTLMPAFKLLALAIPLWVLLFFIFPRFTTGLWNAKAPDASTGFSENLDPGSISRLVDSDETAFRAQFTFGRAPSPESLYWRGAILTHGDGLKWSRAPNRSLRSDTILRETIDRQSVEYTVYIEPGFQKWLFVLDFPTSFTSPDQALLSRTSAQPGFIYESGRALYARASYTARSVQRAPTQAVRPRAMEPFLELPASLSPRVRELARSIQSSVDLSTPDARTPDERLARAVAGWFPDHGFRYTKIPGALRSGDGNEQLDEFLFEKKLGFCEHYAAAFATLVRAMGIPARVVVGFQGGAPNDLGGYWIVRRLDAHAWAEIFARDPRNHEQGKWIRIDPTELIAPLRLQLGGDYYKLDGSALAGGAKAEELRRQLQEGIAGFIRRTQYAWDAVQMRWNAFMLSYDLDYQTQLLRALGFKGSVYLALAAVLATALLAYALGYIWVVRRRARRQDPVLMEWRKFCDQLGKSGTSRLPAEGPLTYAARAANNHPQAAGEILAISQKFAELRYGAPAERAASLSELRQSVRRFSIKAISRSTTS